MRLKYIREQNNHLQLTTASLLNVQRGTYAAWEVGSDIIPIKRLIEFCNIYDVSLDYVLELTNIKNYSDNKKRIDLKLSGKRLKEIRKEHKHTQDYIGKKLDIDRSLISKYENGENVISTTFLIEYNKLYNISCDYLLGKRNQKEIPQELVSN